MLLCTRSSARDCTCEAAPDKHASARGQCQHTRAAEWPAPDSLVLCLSWRGTHCSHPAGIAENSHLRKQNYFYYNCITGRFLRDNCPSYLREENFNRLKDGLLNRLTISTGFFLEELRARKYSKVGACKVSRHKFVCWSTGFN